MSIDFTALDNILTETAPEHDIRALELGEVNSTGKPRKPATDAQRAPESIPHNLRKEAEERELMRQAYKGYQENIRRSETLRSEIIKGLRKGEELGDLFLKAIECISTMTGDRAFYTQCRELAQSRKK